MADDDRCENELPDMCDVLEGLDPNLINILKQVGEIDNAEIELEMMDNFTKQEIIETRLKVFGAAKEKAARSLCQANAGGIFGSDYVCDAESELLSKRAVDQWELVVRRKVHNFAKDALELLTFALDPDALFPAKVVKNLSLNKGSFESAPDAEEAALVKLAEDIEHAKGDYTVEIVTSTGDSETHLITIESDNLTQPGDRGSDSEESESEESGESDEERPDTIESKTISTTLNTCDKPIDPLVELVSNFVEMSKRMLEAISGKELPSRTAQQFHSEYVERVTLENNSKMKRIEKWQKAVDERLDRLENAAPTHPKLQPQCDNSDRSVPRVVEQDGNVTAKQLNQRDRKAPLKRGRNPPGNGKKLPYAQGGNDEPNVNDPPVDAVSQRRTENERRPTMKDGKKLPSNEKTGNIRKQFPPRSYHQTPNPRLNANVNKKGNDAGHKANNERKDNEDNQHVSFEDDNPYSPLAEEPETVMIDEPVRKSPTFGRGRGRKRMGVTRPGPIQRNLPPKQTQKEKVVNPRSMSNVERNQRDVAPAPDVSSSWYDEEDEDADQSLFDAMEHHEDTDGADDARSNSDHDNGNIVTQENEGRMVSHPSTSRDVPERGRKRTSTREAPYDSPQLDQRVGRSTAPLNKKPKVDNRVMPERKRSYSGALEHNQWDKATGKNKRRSKLGNKKIPELKSAAEVALREVYVQELDCSTCRGSREFEEMVLNYCRKRGLKAVDACTIPVKNCRTKSGCKLTVQDADFDTAMTRDFWPRGTSVRPWSSKPRSDSNDEYDDESLSE